MKTAKFKVELEIEVSMEDLTLKLYKEKGIEDPLRRAAVMTFPNTWIQRTVMYTVEIQDSEINPL